MSSVNPFRLKLSRLRNRYYFDTSSSEEESALEADFDPKESEAHVASPSIASTESSVVDDDGTHSVAYVAKELMVSRHSSDKSKLGLLTSTTSTACMEIHQIPCSRVVAWSFPCR